MEVSFVADQEKDSFSWDMWKGSITHQTGHISTDSREKTERNMTFVGPNQCLQIPPSPVLFDSSSQSKSSLGNHSGGWEVESSSTSNTAGMKPNAFSVQCSLAHQPSASSGRLALFFLLQCISQLLAPFHGGTPCTGAGRWQNRTQHLGASRPDTGSRLLPHLLPGMGENHRECCIPKVITAWATGNARVIISDI